MHTNQTCLLSGKPLMKLLTKKQTKISPKLLLKNNKRIKRDKDIAETLNQYYGSVAEEIKSKIPLTNKIFTDYLSNPTANFIDIIQTNPLDIFKLINTMDESKATGPNSIPPFFLKIVAPIASDILCSIINECLDNGIYPNCLKKTTIKPLHKKSSKLEVGNYRPISLLSNINKIFEKVLHTRLVDFFNETKSFIQTLERDIALTMQ